MRLEWVVWPDEEDGLSAVSSLSGLAAVSSLFVDETRDVAGFEGRISVVAAVVASY